MKKRTVEVVVALGIFWRRRARLHAEGNKLRAEGNRFWAEGDKLHAEGNRLRAEGNRLWAEGEKLYAEGNKLWAEGIIELLGNVMIEWTVDGCTVDDDLNFKNV